MKRFLKECDILKGINNISYHSDNSGIQNGEWTLIVSHRFVCDTQAPFPNGPQLSPIGAQLGPTRECCLGSHRQKFSTAQLSKVYHRLICVCVIVSIVVCLGMYVPVIVLHIMLNKGLCLYRNVVCLQCACPLTHLWLDLFRVFDIGVGQVGDISGIILVKEFFKKSK